ncbi:hypothetical protein HGB24_03470 [Candidatus Saccharibacteria bacterium]|nr:hypothetical protein [Candidatus Saccharibacteria bacterium]
MISSIKYWSISLGVIAAIALLSWALGFITTSSGWGAFVWLAIMGALTVRKTMLGGEDDDLRKIMCRWWLVFWTVATILSIWWFVARG